MKIAQPPDRRRAVRMLALAWVVAAVAVAALQGVQVASALDTGLMSFPSRTFALVRVSRVGEPGLFHAILIGAMLIGMLCLGSAARVLRAIVSGRATEDVRAQQG